MIAADRPAIARTPVLRLLALALAAAWLATFTGSRVAAAPGEPVWKVYAIRYATVNAYPVHNLVAGADTARKLDIAMMFWLLDAPGHHVLVDAGFYRKKFLDDWSPAGFIRPSDAVQRFGISPDSITDVIVSHVHWDHLDGADLFPNARIWIQANEYTYYVGDAGKPLHDAIDAIDALDAQMLFKLHETQRLNLVKGDAQEILPGVTAYTGGKHTYASQYVGVRTAKGIVIVASDNLYLYENLEKHAAIAATLDSLSNLRAQDRMRKLASSSRLIVPGHDPLVFQRYKQVGEGVVRVE